MRMRIFLPLALLACALCAACQQPDAPTPQSVAVVDMARLLRDSEPGKAGAKFLESLRDEAQTKLNDIQKRLDANAKDENLQKELQNAYMSAQQRMQAEQQNVITLLYDTVQRVLNAYRAEKGYTVILNNEAAVAADPKADVTNDVLAAMNREKVEFRPVMPDATDGSKPATGEAVAPAPRDGKPEAKDAPAGGTEK